MKGIEESSGFFLLLLLFHHHHHHRHRLRISFQSNLTQNPNTPRGTRWGENSVRAGGSLEPEQQPLGPTGETGGVQTSGQALGQNDLWASTGALGSKIARTLQTTLGEEEEPGE